jgi:hypothetical protein
VDPPPWLHTNKDHIPALVECFGTPVIVMQGANANSLIASASVYKPVQPAVFLPGAGSLFDRLHGFAALEAGHADPGDLALACYCVQGTPLMSQL